jgi:hypothetical protein
MVLIDLRLEKHDEEYAFQHAGLTPRFATFAAFIVGVILFSASQSNAFIYFQF